MPAAQVRVIVSVDDTHLPNILDVAQSLRELGLDVEEVMDLVGVITGSCKPETVDTIAHMASVASVEEEQEYQLPPPDSEIQ